MPIQIYYEGYWEKGLRSGVGVMNFGYEYGTKLTGLWFKNIKHGAGLLMLGNGNIIENNPLFLNDKPVHTKQLARSKSSLLSYRDSSLSTKFTSSIIQSFSKLIANQNEIGTYQLDSDTSSEQSVTADVDMVDKIIQKWGMETSKLVDKVNLEDFLKPREICTAMEIPIHATPDDVDLSFYIQKLILGCKGQCYYYLQRKDSIK